MHIYISILTLNITLTIQQLINQYKVILNRLLIKLAEIPPTQDDKTVEKLQDQGCIGVALGHGDQTDILVLNMSECGRAQSQNGRSYLRIGDDLDAKDVCKAGTAFGAE